MEGIAGVLKEHSSVGKHQTAFQERESTRQGAPGERLEKPSRTRAWRIPMGHANGFEHC